MFQASPSPDGGGLSEAFLCDLRMYTISAPALMPVCFLDFLQFEESLGEVTFVVEGLKHTLE